MATLIFLVGVVALSVALRLETLGAAASDSLGSTMTGGARTPLYVLRDSASDEDVSHATIENELMGLTGSKDDQLGRRCDRILCLICWQSQCCSAGRRPVSSVRLRRPAGKNVHSQIHQIRRTSHPSHTTRSTAKDYPTTSFTSFASTISSTSWRNGHHDTNELSGVCEKVLTLTSRERRVIVSSERGCVWNLELAEASQPLIGQPKP